MAPTHAPLARASLDSSKYTCINVFLKSLKSHTRTFGALFAQHATELAVLERIYYLNNNQHRPALFWQRIVEARRYSRRLRSFDVPSLVDGLRRSFYGDTVDASSKLQKGAWTHYPSVSFFKSFLTRVGTCTALLDKTCVRMRAIYHTLTLAMQSGAFLHLVVTLTALVARIAHLSSAIRSVLSALHTECAHLLATLYPTEASHNLVPLLPPPPPQTDGEDTKVSGSPQEHSRRTVPDADLDVYVDFGEAVTRTPGLTSRPKSGSAPPVLPDLSPVHDATFAPVIRAQRPVAIATDVGVDHAPPPSAPGLSSRVVTSVVVKKQNRAKLPSSSRTTTEERKEKKAHKPRKPPRDEIDDIFA